MNLQGKEEWGRWQLVNLKPEFGEYYLKNNPQITQIYADLRRLIAAPVEHPEGTRFNWTGKKAQRRRESVRIIRTELARCL